MYLLWLRRPSGLQCPDSSGHVFGCRKNASKNRGMAGWKACATAAAMLACALGAQTQQLDKQELNRMLDELRAAIRVDDWAEASRISIRINAALLQNRSRTQ